MIEPLGGAVGAELRRLGPGGDVVELVRAWPAAVGAQIARNAWPARFARDGTLHVATSSSAWAFELGQLEADIRGRLGRSAPKRLRFAPGPLPEGHGEEAKLRPADVPRPTAREWAEAEALAATIDAGELRSLVTRAAAASLARTRSDRSF